MMLPFQGDLQSLSNLIPFSTFFRIFTHQSADTPTDSSKEKGLQDDPQTLEIPGGPWRDRTSDPLIKSDKSSNTCQDLIYQDNSNLWYFLTKRFEEVH